MFYRQNPQIINFIVFLIILLSTSHSAFATKLTISVCYPNGEPAPEISIHGLQNQNRDIWNKKIGKTDDKGLFTIEFMDERKYSNLPGPRGYGVYRFLWN